MALQNSKMKAKIAMMTTTPKYEVMISYDPEDKAVVKKMKDLIQKQGINAWIADTDAMAGADIFNAIGRIIVDCKAFVFIMSNTSVQSKLCQDQLALAYVSKKNIFPVQLNEKQELLQHMDNGMKLQLAGFDWYSLCLDFDEEINILLDSLIDEVRSELQAEKEKGDKKKEDIRHTLKREKSRANLNKSLSNTKMKSRLHLENAHAYWSKVFQNDTIITWKRFRNQLLQDFKEDFEDTFGDTDTEWLISILHREMEVEANEMLSKDNFIAFCTVEDVVQPLWLRIQEQARESYAMRGVFSMESSVRVQAIENLGKYKSATVIDALTDLLTDSDPNIQAVAIISLARTGAGDKRTIISLIKCLRAKDRVVREAACLALGHVKATQAVERLVDLWRNDIISNVREAALVALKNIGGEKAEEAIRITTVLEKEIRVLKT